MKTENISSTLRSVIANRLRVDQDIDTSPESYNLVYVSTHNNSTHDHICVYDMKSSKFTIRLYVVPGSGVGVDVVKRAEGLEATEATFTVQVSLPIADFQDPDGIKVEGDYNYTCPDLAMYLKDLGVLLAEQEINGAVLLEGGGFITL